MDLVFVTVALLAFSRVWPPDLLGRVDMPPIPVGVETGRSSLEVGAWLIPPAS